MESIEYRVTFSTITPESVDHGDFESTGFVLESYIPNNVADIVSLIKRYGCYYWSNSDGTGWICSDYEMENYSTAEEIQYCIHAVNGRSAKFLRYALEIARV